MKRVVTPRAYPETFFKKMFTKGIILFLLIFTLGNISAWATCVSDTVDPVNCWFSQCTGASQYFCSNQAGCCEYDRANVVPSSWTQPIDWGCDWGQLVSVSNCHDYESAHASFCCDVYCNKGLVDEIFVGPALCGPSAPAPPPCVPSCAGRECGSDGCSGVCGSYGGGCQTGYSCSVNTCILNIECGNGVTQVGETCDDGDTGDGDGCNSTCQIEDGWTCVSEPSVCSLKCQFASSSWSVDEAENGTSVELTIQGNSFCDGKNVTFEIFENEFVGRDAISNNPENSLFVGNSVVTTWIAEWIDDGTFQGNPEYVFKASLVDFPFMEIDDEEELIVLPEGGDLVNCDNVVSCSNYFDSGDCSSDYCGVVEGSVESNNPFVTCSNGDIFCECAWVSDSCEPAYSVVEGGNTIGSCSYSESTGDDCTDGFLSYSWTETWLWGHFGWATIELAIAGGPSAVEGDYYLYLVDGEYYYDPNNEFENCKAGNTKVGCPSQVQLGFFGAWNFVIAIIVLVGVYFLIERKKK